MKMTEAARAEKLAGFAPPLSDGELAAINSEYTAYIFRNRKKREIWTTCCGRHEIIPKQEYSDAMAAVLDADHQAEERGWGGHYCHMGYMSAPPQKERVTTRCPFCGRDAYVKELGRTGKRDNLAEYRRFVVFRWYRGALWARAYYTAKRYGSEYFLTDKPEWWIYKVYRFRPGEALCANSWNGGGSFHGITRLMERPKKLPIKFYEPFPHNAVEGMGYSLVGADEIKKSPFRYCQHKAYCGRYSSHMKFLAVCCHWPRQVEMLMKAGLAEAVADIAEGRKWNASAFDWAKDNPLESFQLSKNELREFLASSKDLEMLGYYKQLRRQGLECRMADVDDIIRIASRGKVKTVLKLIKQNRIPPARWNAYIQKETASANGTKKRALKIPSDLSQYWIDYMSAAEALGYDLRNPLMAMPKGLIKKHDAAVKAAAPIINAKRQANLGVKEAKRLKQATERYEFALGEYIIRAPIDSEEIVSEGKALKHCVGGYAERHMHGKLTILFLRKATAPHTPLVTIEINGSQMVQIHGYKNDLHAKRRPREAYAEILDPWLRWIEKGSKRDKDGAPVLEHKRKQPARISVAASA